MVATGRSTFPVLPEIDNWNKRTIISVPTEFNCCNYLNELVLPLRAADSATVLQPRFATASENDVNRLPNDLPINHMGSVIPVLTKDITFNADSLPYGVLPCPVEQLVAYSVLPCPTVVVEKLDPPDQPFLLKFRLPVRGYTSEPQFHPSPEKSPSPMSASIAAVRAVSTASLPPMCISVDYCKNASVRNDFNQCGQIKMKENLYLRPDVWVLFQHECDQFGLSESGNLWQQFSIKSNESEHLPIKWISLNFIPAESSPSGPR